jgi:hypothetical protein
VVDQIKLGNPAEVNARWTRRLLEATSRKSRRSVGLMRYLPGSPVERNGCWRIGVKNVEVTVDSEIPLKKALNLRDPFRAGGDPLFSGAGEKFRCRLSWGKVC